MRRVAVLVTCPDCGTELPRGASAQPYGATATYRCPACGRIVKRCKTCERQVYKGGEFCLMHSPDPKKDSMAFGEEVRRQLELSNLSGGVELADFSGFHFPNYLRVAHVRYTANFSRAHFHGPVSFSDPRSGSYDFTEAVFHTSASFDVRGSELKFSGCTFKGDLRIGYGTAVTNFDAANFEGRAIFDHCRLTQASFREARFANSVLFKDTDFGDQPAESGGCVVDFTNAAFEKPASVRWFRVNRRGSHPVRFRRLLKYDESPTRILHP
jgi:predicted RNA-binding Zn-ribbon protein involved in translation (DUF1610 family)